VKLCGHATLASAHVMMSHDKKFQGVRFESLSGPLSVAKAGPRLELDFPRHEVRPQPEALAKVAALLRREAGSRCMSAKDYDAYLALYEKAADIEASHPEFHPSQCARPHGDRDGARREWRPTSSPAISHRPPASPEDPVTWLDPLRARDLLVAPA
jgi:hypothetical protein